MISLNATKENKFWLFTEGVQDLKKKGKAFIKLKDGSYAIVSNKKKPVTEMDNPDDTTLELLVKANKENERLRKENKDLKEALAEAIAEDSLDVD